MKSASTTLVTVTYADRMHFLQELLHRAFETEGLANALIVSNASRSDLSKLEEKWGSRIRIVRLAENTGSANGYAEGIRAALEAGAGYLWLMDDDNAPKPGALGVLHRKLDELAAQFGRDRAAVLGFRPDHQADIAAGVVASKAVPPRSSFIGFHYRQIPFKIWRRLIRGRLGSSGPVETVRLPYAPYGGLLASRDLFERIGLPKRELVLYADDTEYTYRITASGGAIEVMTGAELDDMEGSWNLKSRHPNAFIGWLKGESDLRAFYGLRNQVWFDRNRWVTSTLEYRINQLIFIGLLKFYAKRTGSPARLRLLMRAIRDGQASSLGIEPELPLS
ncbi:glycosyl transferase family 2 [Dyella japonica DSM 16301]|uniref:Glycosyl transferase family 2 n=1 Tax=Dyella japonica DSM 16301 TaxID=1440762 RepID=A0A0G9H0Y7_9GAMM|nr:glycosyl transferase family 2 [Dyella japonica DSM 16301]